MLVERLSRIALLGSAWILYLLFALSIASLAAALERWIFFARRTDDLDALGARFAAALESSDLERARAILQTSRSIEAGIVLSALRWAHGGPRALADALEAALAGKRRELSRSTNLLATLGNNAPFIGLLGTVIGIINAFHQLGDAGQNKAAMGNVMSGIAEALIATGVGLFVALPAVVIYNLIQKRITDVETGVQLLGKLAGAFVESRERAGLPLPRRMLADAEAVAAEQPALAQPVEGAPQ